MSPFPIVTFGVKVCFVLSGIERTPLYEKYADIVVDQEGKDLEASLELLLETLKEKAK